MLRFKNQALFLIFNLLLVFNLFGYAQEVENVEKRVVMIIAQRGFRDEELVEPKMALEKKGVNVTIASSSLEEARGMLGLRVKPDILIEKIDVQDYHAIIFVGGIGAREYWNDALSFQLIEEAVNLRKIVGAICIAPVTLANAGVLEGRRATVWPSERRTLESKGVIYTGRDVEVDGSIITASGPQAAGDFANALIRALEN